MNKEFAFEEKRKESTNILYSKPPEHIFLRVLLKGKLERIDSVYDPVRSFAKPKIGSNTTMHQTKP